MSCKSSNFLAKSYAGPMNYGVSIKLNAFKLFFFLNEAAVYELIVIAFKIYS